MSRHSDLDVQRQRAAKNQSLFREVNERIEDLAATASFSMFICECLDESCHESVPLTIEEYEHIRAEANSFVVLQGHEVPDLEETVEATERYLVVRKLGAGELVAEALEPRSRQRADGAERHDRAAQRHTDAADRHEASTRFWKAKGDEARASLEQRRVANQRDGAEIEHDHAQLERDEAEAADGP